MSVFGRVYRTFTFGESHAKVVGCVVQGFPSGFQIDFDHIQSQLNRRKPGQSSITTPRKQQDLFECVSGIQKNISLGCPLTFLVKNQNIKSSDYDSFSDIPRPGHADYTYLMKYGIKASSGGGRSSARETIGRIISGALAKQYLKKIYGVDFSAWVYQIGEHHIPQYVNQKFINDKISNQFVQTQGKISTQNEQLNLRCPHAETSSKMLSEIRRVKSEGDSVGGIVQSCIYNLPVGLGQPVFDKIQAVLAHAMLSIPATKGFQFGSGFSAAKMKGSKHNDMFQTSNSQQKNKLKLSTNNSGGSLGGISTGQTFCFKVSFKPVSTISQYQNTVNYQGKKVILQAKGRHDPCVLPRAPPIVDNMAAMTIMDLVLLNKIHKI